MIRSAFDSDADGLAALWLQLNQTGERTDERYRLRHDADAVGHRLVAEHWLANDDVQVVVADDDGTLVGFVATRPLGATTARIVATGSFITDLFVADSHRRQGIGTLLVTTVIDREIVASGQSLEVGTFAKDARAIAFWRSLGFDDWRVTLQRQV